MLKAEFNAALESANAGSDMAVLDTVDNFRQTLTPELQTQYDAQLQQLRDDPRIQFAYQPGVQPSPNPALEDMTLRGMLAASFGNEAKMNATIDAAVAANDAYNGGASGDGHLVFRFYDGPALTDEGKEAAGWAVYGAGEIRMDTDYTIGALSKGDSVPQHEFSHFFQGYNQPQGHYPAGFPFEDAMNQALDAAPDGAFADRGGETWPDLQNKFKQYPEKLQEEYPDIYRMMVEYSGYDPIARQSVPPVRLDGTGDVQTATQALAQHFSHVSGDGTFITQQDLENLLSDPDPSIPGEVRAAAAFLLSSPTSRYVVDTASNGNAPVDGNISLSDLQSAVGIAESNDYLHALLDTADGKGGRDRYISGNDIRAALSDPGIPAEQRDQLQQLVASNPMILLSGMSY
ncbi:MAG: hypothetical protein DI635_12345 [Pseudoxanthomonas suwonensis]|nr:MAG: hypothetical protein DI635_12345 [Pseudoxanthomonas suwonensis]